MCEMCCTCKREPGQTVVGEMTEDGLMCLQCRKMIAWQQEDLEDEIQEVELDLRLYGKAAFICDHCKGLSFWHGSDEQLEIMMEDLRESDAMLCPICNGKNKITDQVREMLR